MEKNRVKTVELTVEELGVEVKPTVTTFKVESPPEREEGVKVENVDVLVEKLKNEAKVIWQKY